MRRLLNVILSGLGIEVDEASSNQQCRSALSKSPRVAVVDVDPSFEQGMVVWHSLRRNPSTANIPSVFLVEAGNESIRHLATMAGATICLDKPFHPQHLRTSVERLVSLGPRSNGVDARCSHARWSSSSSSASRLTDQPGATAN